MQLRKYLICLLALRYLQRAIQDRVAGGQLDPLHVFQPVNLGHRCTARLALQNGRVTNLYDSAVRLNLARTNCMIRWASENWESVCESIYLDRWKTDRSFIS